MSKRKFTIDISILKENDIIKKNQKIIKKFQLLI